MSSGAETAARVGFVDLWPAISVWLIISSAMRLTCCLVQQYSNYAMLKFGVEASACPCSVADEGNFSSSSSSRVSGSFTLDHPVDAMLSIMFALLLPWSLMLFPMSFAIAGRSLLLVQIELVADIDASCNSTEQLHFAQNIIPNKGYPIGNAEKNPYNTFLCYREVHYVMI